MKKKLFTFLAIVLFSSQINAQFNKKAKEKIRAYKIAFITDKLDLSEQEAEKFWPIYNVYDKKMIELRRQEHIEVRKKTKKQGGFENLSEEEAKSILKSLNDLMNERHENRTRFFTKIEKFLSHKKMLQLEIAEHEFNRKLMRKLKGKRKP